MQSVFKTLYESKEAETLQLHTENAHTAQVKCCKHILFVTEFNCFYSVEIQQNMQLTRLF